MGAFMRGHLRRCFGVFFLSGLGLVLAIAATPAVAQQSAESILNARCAACHEKQADGKLSRIGEVRKTPEGWDMNIARMGIMHGVEVTSDERRALVKHLADTQGLAPSETRDWRYILERQPSAIESAPDENLMVMCGRCHSYARTALQRRDEGEWLKHVHFHLGQWPTTEYQALGRDRNWWDIASTDVPPALAKLYPFKTREWDQWRTRKAPDLSGTWRFVGNRAGTGTFQGVTSVSARGGDKYSLKTVLTYADGSKQEGKGNAILYTGYEWRASLKIGKDEILQVLAVSANGSEMSGRWFLEDQDSIGGPMMAVRGGSQILSLSPPYIRAGETARIAIHGVGLKGAVSLGDGVTVKKLVSQSPNTIVVDAAAASGAGAGQRNVTVGAATGPKALAVFKSIDAIRVEPAYTIARVGGGAIPPVPAQFEAVAYLNGPDGKPGTADDVRVGAMPAKWSVANYGDFAIALDDVKFTGKITGSGQFQPAAAGPNPQRPFSTNNAGDLAVNAKVSVGGQTLEGSGHLVVTVQRWNDPPIR